MVDPDKNGRKTAFTCRLVIALTRRLCRAALH